MPAPHIDFGKVGMEAERGMRERMDRGPGDHEQKEKGQNCPSVALVIKPKSDPAFERRKQATAKFWAHGLTLARDARAASRGQRTDRRWAAPSTYYAARALRARISS